MRCCNGYSRYMDDVVSLSDGDLVKLGRAVYAERMKRRGALKKCRNCQELFAGRRDARFCSARCRVAAHRASRMEAA